jgi:LacI family transcriptional regulator
MAEVAGPARLVQHAARVEFIAASSPTLLAQHLRASGARSTASPSWRWSIRRCARPWTALAERGVPTLTLISDIANTRRAAYVGLDNRSAGRTAGYLIARFIGPARPRSR